MNKFLPVFDGVSMARITPPAPALNFIFRSSLVERINQPAPHATLLVAPSGYGKTSLAIQAVQSTDDLVVFYTVEELDTVLSTCKNVTSALRLQIPNFAPWAEDFFESKFDGVEWVTRLLNDISKVPNTIFFVWDGAQNYSDAHLGMLQTFINYMPKNVRILTLRNLSPKVSYAHFASQGKLDYISAQELKFSELETKQIADQNGLDYSNPELKLSFDSVQGWPAGIQLLAKSIARNGNLESVTNLDGKTLVKHAVDTLQLNDLNFLESISLLESVTYDEVVNLSQNSDAETILKHLSEDGIYVTASKSTPIVFTINPLIREELASRVLSNSKKAADIGYKSVEVAIKAERNLTAIRILMLLGEQKRADRLSSENIYQMLMEAKSELLETWISKLDDDFEEAKFSKTILGIYAKLVVGNFETANTMLVELENNPQMLPFVKSHQDEINFVKSRLLFRQCKFEECVNISVGAVGSSLLNIEGLPSRLPRGLMPGLESAFILHDFENFNLIYTKISVDSEDHAPHYSKMMLPQCEAMKAFLDGRYKSALDYANLAMYSAEKLKISGMYIPFPAAYIAADVYLEFGDEAKSLEVVDKYLPAAIKLEQWPWVVALLVKRALVLLQQGRVLAALNELRDARSYVNTSEFGRYATYLVDSCEILICIFRGEHERIVELMCRLPANSLTRHLQSIMEIKRNPSDVIRLVNSLPEETQHEKFLKNALLTEAYISNRSVAMRHLEATIEIAIANGYFRAFLNMSSDVKTLILELAGEKPTFYMERLVIAIRIQMQMGTGESGLENHSLTKRELDILRRLDTGLPITQIAASLHISNNTIKTHLKNVYRKMNVESREEAVSRGKELLLL